MSLSSVDMTTGAERAVEKIDTRDAFAQVAKAETDRWQREYNNVERPTVLVGISSSSVAHGAWKVYFEFIRQLQERKIAADVRVVSEMGTNWAMPVVDIIKPGKPRIAYQIITADKVGALIDRAIVGDEPGRMDGDPTNDIVPLCVYGNEAWDGATARIGDVPLAKELPFYEVQQRILMRNFGYTNPRDIYDYIGRGGYTALGKALFDMEPTAIIEEIKKSNLRGRGGAGFTAGVKWEGARNAKGSPKYVVCNAHEGEPNVFKDRRIMEGDPHMLIEGMIIEAFACDSHIGYIYIGDEYPLAIRSMEHAVEQARQAGFLGKNILGSGYDLDIQVYMGGGAYISGEASALQFGIEGQRAMPRTKPPRSVEAGVWGKPTCVNNVETMMNVPDILNRGADWFLGLGTQKSPGTKMVTLMGLPKYVGLSEVPLGTTMRDIVFKIGGGIRNDRPFKAIQTGGTSGGLMLDQNLDLQMTFDNGPQDMGSVGGVLGSGGFVVYDDSVSIVDMTRYWMRFNRYESCGKCVPCRIGTKSLLDILDRIATGLGRVEDMDALKEWSEHVISMSLCGLGQAAPLPTLSAIKLFRDEFMEAILNQNDPTGRNEALVAIQQLRALGQPAPRPQLTDQVKSGNVITVRT